jgi:hypothetical protein
LEIRFGEDLGPHGKLIHSLKKCSHAIIVTADDDILYSKLWLKELYDSYLKNPACIHCHAAHLMKKAEDGTLRNYTEWAMGAPQSTEPDMLLFPRGVGGVLYAPNSLNIKVFDKKVFMELCPTNDDIWFKAMSLLNGVACQKVNRISKGHMSLRGNQGFNLKGINVHQGQNDVQIRKVFKKYDLYRLL